MPQEVELKLLLLLPPRTNVDLDRLTWLKDLASGEERHQRLVSVYFDTAKRKLRRHGLTLRLRHIGASRVQTVKALTRGARSALGSDEWETEIDGDKPDLKRTRKTALRPLIGKKQRGRLAPVFTTDVQRTTVPLRSARNWSSRWIAVKSTPTATPHRSTRSKSK